MDLTKREYTMHDHNTLLKEFILNNEGKLKKLQDDAKIAQVRSCTLATHRDMFGSLKPTWVLAWLWGNMALRLLRVDFFFS